MYFFLLFNFPDPKFSFPPPIQAASAARRTYYFLLRTSWVRLRRLGVDSLDPVVGFNFVPIFGEKHLKNGIFGLCEPISPILLPFFMIFSDFPVLFPDFRIFLHVNQFS